MRKTHSPLRRRLVLGACGALAVASARAEKSIARVAVLAAMDESDRHAWRMEFARHGYHDGRNLRLSFEDWGSDADLLEARARAIVASRPDLICSVFTTPSLVLARLTRDIPIVFFSAVDPDRTGLVQTLRVPGRNLTGVSNHFRETVGKRFELLRELRPGSRAIALVARKQSLWWRSLREAIASSADRFGLVMREVAVSEKADAENLAQALRKTGADAFVPTDVALAGPVLVQIQTGSGTPGLFANRGVVRAGGLLSVGPAWEDIFARGVAMAARILQGEKPERFPVDQATRIETVLNLRTAEAFGCEVSQAVLLRVTEVVK